jgi:hypothetical protein
MEGLVLKYQNAINSKAGRLGPTGGLGVWDTAVLIDGSPSALSAQPLAYIGPGLPTGRAEYVTAGNPGLQGSASFFGKRKRKTRGKPKKKTRKGTRKHIGYVRRPRGRVAKVFSKTGYKGKFLSNGKKTAAKVYRTKSAASR